MNKPLRKLLGVMGIGLTWGFVWGAFFLTLVLIIGTFRPQDVGPGEGPLVATGTGLVVGFVSGTVFGILVSFAEDRKTIFDLSLLRVVLWSTVASSLWPLLTAVDDRMVFILCPLGAVCGVASVAIARRAQLAEEGRAQLLGFIGLLMAKPLQAAGAADPKDDRTPVPPSTEDGPGSASVGGRRPG